MEFNVRNKRGRAAPVLRNVDLSGLERERRRPAAPAVTAPRQHRCFGGSGKDRADRRPGRLEDDRRRRQVIVSLRQLAADRAICRRVGRCVAIGRLPERALLRNNDARCGFGRRMDVRSGDNALPGKGQQRRKQDKPWRPGLHRAQTRSRRPAHRGALFTNRPAVGQSRALSHYPGSGPTSVTL